MKLADLKEAFVANALALIDMVHPGTGKGAYSGETLEEIQKRHPTAQRVNFDEWLEKKEAALCTEPVRITEERFMEMLEVLPPQRWQIGRGAESFELCEHTSGRITAIYCRFGDRYYEFEGQVGKSLEEHARICREDYKP